MYIAKSFCINMCVPEVRNPFQIFMCYFICDSLHTVTGSVHNYYITNMPMFNY